MFLSFLLLAGAGTARPGDALESCAHVVTTEYVRERIAEPASPDRLRIRARARHVLGVGLHPEIVQPDQHDGGWARCEPVEQAIQHRRGGIRLCGVLR